MTQSFAIRRILLVEDEETDAALVTLHLRRLPAAQRPEVVRASTLGDALLHLETGTFDCVLLDLGLPDGQGLENVQRIRAAAADATIVVLTGNDDGRMARSALRCGAQEYLIKGNFNDETLLRVLNHAIERHGVMVELDRQRQRHSFLAGHDALTGLINRQMLAERAQEIIAQCERRRESFALCFLDLDGFKPVNDRYGHAVGDAVLKEVGSVLTAAARASDSVARIGGDEFVVLLFPVSGIEEAERAALRLVQRVNAIQMVDGYAVSIGASAGLAQYPNHGLGLDELVLKADKAMYSAKQSGRGSLKVSTEASREPGASAGIAIDDANLALLYQPWFDQAGAFGGVETLLRQRVGGELISPDAALRSALEFGLMGDVCQWVLRGACASWKSWHDADRPVGRLAINVSRAEISRPDLPGLILNILRDARVLPQHVQIELPEDVFGGLSAEVLENIRVLRAHGVRIVMDSFGKTSAALRPLLNMPLDGVKLDRSLIHGLRSAHGPHRAMVAAIVAVANAQGLETVATGIEQEADLSECRTLGCRYFQGQRLSPPLTAEQLEESPLLPRTRRRLELVKGTQDKKGA